MSVIHKPAVNLTSQQAYVKAKKTKNYFRFLRMSKINPIMKMAPGITK
jgi:hypothetical protein